MTKRTEIIETYDQYGRLVEKFVRTDITYDDGTVDTECHGCSCGEEEDEIY